MSFLNSFLFEGFFTFIESAVGLTNYILLETGDVLLLETGDKILLE